MGKFKVGDIVRYRRTADGSYFSCRGYSDVKNKWFRIIDVCRIGVEFRYQSHSGTDIYLYIMESINRSHTTVHEHPSNIESISLIEQLVHRINGNKFNNLSKNK